MGRVVGVFDQALVDVIAGAVAQEGEVEILAQRGEVLNRVVRQPEQPDMIRMNATTWMVIDR
jgi:hypothetical protein